MKQPRLHLSERFPDLIARTGYSLRAFARTAGVSHSTIMGLIHLQVKSRYATDCDRGFPVKATSFDAFDFLVVAFLNIGMFYGRHDGSTGGQAPEFFTLPSAFIREHHRAHTSWPKVRLRGLETELAAYAGEAGFEQIAQTLGVPRPRKVRL